MTVTTTSNGDSNHGMEFTDIKLQKEPKVSVAGNGPWTHSTNSYSRKLNNSTSIVDKSSFSNAIIVIVIVIVFLVGLGLGIVIGIYAIDQDSDSSANIPVVTAARSISDMPTTKATTVKANSPKPCNCPTVTNIPCVCPTVEYPETTPRFTTTGNSTIRDPFEDPNNDTYISIFAPLQSNEINKIREFMTNKGFTASFGASLTRNRVAHIYLYPVAKDAALRYLDNGGEFPGRYAKVVVFRGVKLDIMEYKVGPINETIGNMKMVKLRRDGEIDFNRRPWDSAERSEKYIIVRKHLDSMSNLVKESFDGSISFSFAFLPTLNDTDRTSWVYFYLPTGGSSTLRIIPLSCIVHSPGIDKTKWYASDFHYLSQGMYDSGAELQAAYTAGKLRKIKIPAGYRSKHNNEFDLKLNSSLPKREHSDLPPPVTFEPQGPRYTIKGHSIRWMDWEFEYTANPIKGPALFNIRFKGERIAYEMSLQDITLLYAAQSNGAGPPALSDTFFFLGNFHSPKLGVDCPERSSVLQITKYIYGSTSVSPSACVFEVDGQRPLWRHGSKGLTDNYLLIRFPMNLGNYDYSLEWQFHLSGKIETVISASGFLFGSFWDPQDPLVNDEKSSTPFGYRIADYLLGSIHDHSFSFKVDLDILGTDNSFETVHWRGGDVLTALKSQTNITQKPSYFIFNNTRYLEYEFIENETGFVGDPKNPKMWTIVNEKERNVWGNRRGYRIYPHSTYSEHLIEHVMLNAWDHLNYQVVVTKQKDSEEHASVSWYDLMQPNKSFKGVGAMMNNENIRNEDLVLWITEKFLHAPIAEDQPMTLQVNKGFSLTPFNYFDRTPTFDVKGHYSPHSYPYTYTHC